MNIEDIKISNNIKYIGVNDKTIDLFESQYTVPNGISYNSYLILDDKIAVMDTVDARGTDEWFKNLDKTLNGKLPDYLIVSHMEPDHAANIVKFIEKYKTAKIVINEKALAMIPQFFDVDLTNKAYIVNEGETLCLGSHTLQFFMAPMVHWPEVMVEYEQSEKILFSADAFGKFGTLDTDEDWACEARRYYFNIVGKYGSQANALLKKASTLDISVICPLHGPILTENIGYYVDKYLTWTSYEPEDDGVLVAYASIHGNTAKAAKKMAEILEAKGAKKVAVTDLSRDDMAEAVEDAFRYDKMILMAATYDGGVFPCMDHFIHHLKSKNYQKRKVGFVENGSWAPMAAKQMKSVIETLKNINICEPVISIKSAMKDSDIKNMEKLADTILS